MGGYTTIRPPDYSSTSPGAPPFPTDVSGVGMNGRLHDDSSPRPLVHFSRGPTLPAGCLRRRNEWDAVDEEMTGEQLPAVIV